MYELSFDELVTYNSGAPGISLKVELRLGRESVNIEAKVDTGASVCIFSRATCEELGLNIESGRPSMIQTVTGRFRVFGHDVTIITCGLEFDSQVYFAEDESFKNNVLGRLGWLDQVIIGINDYDGRLYLSPYNSM